MSSPIPGEVLSAELPPRRTRVLVVDDEAAMREVLEARLSRWGYEVRTAETVAAAKAAVERFQPDVVVSDLVLPDATGLDLLEALQAGVPERTVLLITAYGTIDTAVKAMRSGATNFLTKPLDYQALKGHLEAAPQLGRRLVSAARAPSTESAVVDAVEPPPPPFGGMVGRSAALLRMQERIRSAANSDAPVLIVGESGTGKELVARAIVELSSRSNKPFVIVNAAAIPESLVEAELFGAEKGAFTGATHARIGLFQQAHEGSLFLDEVTEMPMALQPKLLRALEDGRIRKIGGRGEIPCDVRVIAATNRNPTEAVEQGLLRHDLIYRLDVLRIDVPPLRARAEDVPLIAAHFLADCARRYGTALPPLSDEVLATLAAHDWPGNARELRNVIERAFVAANPGPIQPEHLGMSEATRDGDASGPPARHGIVIPHGLTLADAERILVLETLKKTGNNKAEAARRLGLDVKTIRNKLKIFDEDHR